MWSEFELSSVSDMNGTTGEPVYFGLRAKRISKGLYGISGTITVTDSLENYEVCFFNSIISKWNKAIGVSVSQKTDVKMYYSANGGNDWKPSPINLGRGSLCTKINEIYRKYLMDDMHKVSNLPYTEDAKEPLCDKFEKVIFN